MRTEDVFGMAIFLFCALIMVAIGIYQYNCKDPVGFWSGEKPPLADSLSSVKGYNRAHGLLWIFYGVEIMVMWALSIIINRMIISTSLLCIGIMGGMIVMMILHGKIKRKYKKKENE